jgi:hypothetical protein
MSGSVKNPNVPAPASVIPSVVVTTLPSAGSGTSSNDLQLQDTHAALTQMTLQANIDKGHDPVVKPTGESKQGFCSTSDDTPTLLYIVGALCIVYGIVAK